MWISMLFSSTFPFSDYITRHQQLCCLWHEMLLLKSKRKKSVHCFFPNGVSSHHWTKATGFSKVESHTIYYFPFFGQVALLGSIYMAGYMFAGYPCGYVADKWGRKTAVTVTLAFFGVSLLSGAFMPSYSTYTMARFFAAVGNFTLLQAHSTSISWV